GGLPGAAHRSGHAPRGHPPRSQAPDRDALRARALPCCLRDGDDVARHPHAGARRRAAGRDQAYRPRLSLAHPQRADADGGPRALEDALERARVYEAPCGDFGRIGRYRRARQEVEARRQAMGKGGRRGERGPAEAEPGRLALVRRKGAPSLAMILGVHAIRGHRTLFDALLPHGAVIRLKSGLVKRIFWATPPLHVPRDLRRGEPRGLRHLSEQLERLSVPDLIAREREQGPEAAVAAIECHRCPWAATTRCEHASRDLERLQERVAQRRAALDAFRNAYWQEFLRVVEVLEQFGAVRDGRLLPKGRLIASLRHDNELLLAETVTRGLFDDLTIAEAAALCSALLEE